MQADSKLCANSNGEEPDLYICTLGTFHIRSGEVSISEKAGRSRKVWDLFKYLLINEGRTVPVDTIVDSLWPERENADPRAALQDLVYRVRRLFAEEVPSDQSPVRIEFNRGGYCLTLGAGCWFDLREMERLFQEGASLLDSDPQGARSRYREGVALYGGDCLPEHPYDPWVFPARYYYRRLYMEGVLQLVELLRDAGDHAETIRVCEKAFSIDPFLEAEDLHHRFMQALVEERRMVDALAHYRHLADLLDRELGVKPSWHLRDLNRLLKTDMEVANLDLNAIDERLGEEQEAEGALLCDRHTFRFLHRLEMRRSERSDGVICLGLFSLSWNNLGAPRGRDLGAAMSALKEILTSNLRKGDVITQWNEEQCLVMLPGCARRDSEDLRERIELEFAARSDVQLNLMSQVQAFSSS